MSKKSKSETKPWKEAQPHILGGAKALNDTYAANQGQVQGATDSVVGLLPSMIENFEKGNAATNAATDYNVDVLGGQYLKEGNPYLDDIIGSSNDDLRNQMQAAMGTRGQTGGSSYADLISKNVLQNSTNMRYSDYNNERNRMGQAASQAPSLAAADYLSVTPMLQTLGASTMPMQNAAGYAGGLGGLLGGYTQTTQKKSPWDMLMQGAGSAAGAFAASDIRVKEDVKRIGYTDAGLPLYSFRYKGEELQRIGPMAHEVEEKQPDALGPVIGGIKTVYYGKVR